MSEVSCVEPKGPIDVEDGESGYIKTKLESGGGNSGLLGFVVLVGEQKGSNAVTYKIIHVLASSFETFPPIFVVKKIWSNLHLILVK